MSWELAGLAFSLPPSLIVFYLWEWTNGKRHWAKFEPYSPRKNIQVIALAEVRLW